MPEALRGMGEFELNGLLYSVGGERNPSGSFSNKVLRYDPGTNTWQQLNNFPTIIWDPQAAVCDGRAFMIGGRHGYGQTYDHVYEYSPGTDSWSLRAPMPYHVMKAGVACYGGRVFVFGGNHKISEASNEWVRHVQVYDVATNSWQFFANAMPRQHSDATAIAYGSRIFAFAHRVFDDGLGQFVDNESVDIYDPVADSWSQQPLSWPLYNGIHTSAAGINHHAYFVDWYTPSSEYSNQVFRVNLTAGTSQDCNSNGVPDECEPDSDGDGVIDACDGCPDDPNKVAPGACGCGVADIDTDGDGVPDCIDNCTLTPNPDQEDCDGDGIGDACDDDIDGDGVPNEVDVCPNTPNCESMPDGRPRLDMNGDCNVNSLDIQLIVDAVLAGCSACSAP